MASTHKAEHLLAHHKVRKTNIRIQVLGKFLDAPQQALAHSDLESQFERIDRVTLYRTLKTFEESGLIHEAVDGSGKQKFALCSDDCSEDHHQDDHAHFHCKQCNQTFCLDEVIIPAIKTPNNYQVDTTQLLLSGVCKNCLS